jgi:two-component system, chemotaxis family, CheB/CheR fusion protein
MTQEPGRGDTETPEDGELEALLDFLKRSRGFDFTGYKRASLSRRIEKRMQAVGIEGYAAYIDRLEVDPDEFTHLFNFILINVTSFFRDPEAWDYLGTQIVPRMATSKGEAEPIRVWCPGCASGEEAYSVAMLLAEAVGKDHFANRVKIYATDVDEDALATARRGVYGRRDVDPIPPELLERYFRPSGEDFVFDKDLRRSMVFGRHDLVQGAPISRIDLLVCRNTLMYFNAETQAAIMGRFFFALNEGGFLMLGKSEMMFSFSKAFSPVDLKRRIFAKAEGDGPRDRFLMPAQAGSEEATHRLTSHARGRDAAFDSGPVAQLVVDGRGRLTQANAKAREMFGLSRSDLGRPFQDLEASYRPLELRSLIDRAHQEQRAIRVPGVSLSLPSGAGVMDIDVLPLVEEGGPVLGASLHFTDVTRFSDLQDALENSNQELETAMEELQSTNEELEATNEELQSTNEELEATNEELQSTNEELETMNEELQATNEEASSINEELRSRAAELDEAKSYLETILTTVQASVIVVDRALQVQVWNARSHDLWGLQEDEVRGQRLAELDIGLPVDQIMDGIQACLDGASTVNETTVEAINRRGRLIECRVQCSPLPAREDGVQGVLVIVDELADQPQV